VGVVVIGRNEGERLVTCLKSAMGGSGSLVYVDSGSSDGSVEKARSMGVRVAELDMSTRFTAARARNEGVRTLLEEGGSFDFVQFVDGDCELIPGWIEAAARFLSETPRAAAVCGRLHERHPERSVYNALCDIEWDTPVGEAKACGGIAMFRLSAFEAVGGFRDDLIAGEEPELCVRLREAGWTIWRIDRDMGLHDAAMTRFGQWWKRMVRGGFAYAQAVHLHGAPPENHGKRESRSIWAWAFALPLATLVLAGLIGPWGFALLLAYPLQIVRLALRGDRSPRMNWARSVFLVVGKFAELMGQLKFLRQRVSGRAAPLIEYK
jgi:GT2 family glycosyltransferase